jgi:hypothetical protein
MWHFVWCPLYAVLALTVLLMVFSGQELHTSKMMCWCLVAGLGALALGAAATLPGQSFHSRAATLMPLGRGLIALDGMAFLALAVSIIVGAAREQSLGTFTAMVTGLPLAALALGLILCHTDGELVVAAPVVISFCIGAATKGAYLNGTTAAIPALLLLVLHLALYLPVQADSNPFHTALTRLWKQFIDFMSNPISGFGDGGD